MQWESALAEWREWLLAAGRPQTTISLRTYQMRRFAEDNVRPWAQTHKTLIGWLASQNWAIESRRSYRSALRSFYGWAYASGHIAHDPAALLPPIRPVRHLPRPAPEATLTSALNLSDVRVGLMLMLAAREGLRRGEISRIHTSDVTKDLMGWSLRVHGKGGKVRVIPLHDELALILKVLPNGWVFPGKIDGHLSPAYVGKLMSRALGEGWTAHTLRHRFATITYQGSRDLLAVQGLLGHSKPETTLQYVQLPDDALRAAMRWAA